MMVADRENIMNAISNLGYEVFRNGQFHYNSSNTPDMYINQDGSIHCWTTSPFKNNTSNHGDLIDFLQMININQSFKEAKEEAERLTGLTLPSLDTYKDNGYTIDDTNKKTGFIDEEFIKIFEIARANNFNRYKELLNQTLPSLEFDKQKEIAQKYQIGYIEMSDRLSMPIKDEENRIVTLWKYTKNPSSYINDKNIEVTPNKVLFTKGRERCPFNLYDLKEFRKDLSQEVFLCAGEKDTLNMIGNGFRAVTLGAENENLHEKYKPLFQDLKIIIAYDNDIAGEKGIVKIYEQLKEIAREVKVFDWNEVKKQGIALSKGYDMTDYLVDLKKLNKDFNTNYKDEKFVNELELKIEIEEAKKRKQSQLNKINTKDIKMAVLKLVGKNDNLGIQADNGLQYTKDNEIKTRQAKTAFTSVVKEAANVVEMNKGIVTLNLKSAQGEYFNFYVNKEKETGNILLKRADDPSNENLFIKFDKKTGQRGDYFELNDFNNASSLINAIEINQVGTKQYLNVNLSLKNEELKAALKAAGKDYSAVLTKNGYEIKNNLDLYKNDNSGMENIKAEVNNKPTIDLENTQDAREIDTPKSSALDYFIATKIEKNNETYYYFADKDGGYAFVNDKNIDEVTTLNKILSKREPVTDLSEITLSDIKNKSNRNDNAALESIKKEMSNTQAETNSNNAGTVNFNFNIPSSNKEVIAAFENLMKALKIENIEVKKQETTQQQSYGARTQK